MRSTFTGVRDTDYEILIGLPDEELFNTCQTDRYMASLCEYDIFWKRRTQIKYGRDIQKLEGQTWKEYYIDRIKKYIYRNNYDGIEMRVTVDKNNININNSIDKYVHQVKDIYKGNYFHRFKLKSDEQVRNIVRDVVGKALTYFGASLALSRLSIQIFDDTNTFGENGGKDSVLIPRTGEEKENLPFPGGFTIENMNLARERGVYMDISNDSKPVRIKDAIEKWKRNRNYIYIPSLRVAGDRQQIIDYFFPSQGQQIMPHVNRSYTLEMLSDPNNPLRMSFFAEFGNITPEQQRELEQLGLPIAAPLGPPTVDPFGQPFR